MGGVCSYPAVRYIPRRASGECCVTRFFAVSLCIQAGATAVSENTHQQPNFRFLNTIFSNAKSPYQLAYSLKMKL